MKNLGLGIVVAFGFLISRSASATTSIWYQMPGNSCSLISTSPINHGPPTYAQWGVGSGAATMELTCPVSLPYQAYTAVLFRVNGYNRWPDAQDSVNCTLLATESYGTNPQSTKVTLPFGNGPQTVNSPTLKLNPLPNPLSLPPIDANVMSVTCHLPATSAGISWITSMYLLVTY